MLIEPDVRKVKHIHHIIGLFVDKRHIAAFVAKLRWLLCSGLGWPPCNDEAEEHPISAAISLFRILDVMHDQYVAWW